MSVSSDSSAGAETKRDWRLIRHEYETGSIGLRPLAVRLNIPVSTMLKRSMREGWNQTKRIVRQAAGKLEAEVGDRIQKEIRDELAPWIEENKTRFTKRGFKIASRGVDRVEQMFDSDSPLDPKEESYISKAFETYHRAARTALGMGDGSPTGGAINLNIMTNQAAVQVVTPNESSE